MKRVVVNVSTTDHYRKGQKRLEQALFRMKPLEYIAPWGHSQYETTTIKGVGEWPLPKDWPSHADVPYGFKAAAINRAMKDGIRQIMWCDSCILPVRSLQPIWDYAEKHGAWIANNGYSNYEWTVYSAYEDLFTGQDIEAWPGKLPGVHDSLSQWRELNRKIPHVVATAFAVDLDHPSGLALAKEYIRLGLETKAFCGPWINCNYAGEVAHKCNGRCARCGPSDVRGHRHDQAALSVCAWRYGIPLTECPEFFSYPPPGWSAADPLKGLDERTILVADGSYV